MQTPLVGSVAVWSMDVAELVKSGVESIAPSAVLSASLRVAFHAAKNPSITIASDIAAT